MSLTKLFSQLLSLYLFYSDCSVCEGYFTLHISIEHPPTPNYEARAYEYIQINQTIWGLGELVTIKNGVKNEYVFSSSTIDLNDIERFEYYFRPIPTFPPAPVKTTAVGKIIIYQDEVPVVKMFMTKKPTLIGLESVLFERAGK